MTWENVKILKSETSTVRKYIFEKEDAVAEAVLYRYPSYLERTVICCSTQSGCPMGCRFCGAGDSFARSLSAKEIEAQVERLLDDTGLDVSKIEKLQVMFMSMGEPMLNYWNLKRALLVMHERWPNADLLISTTAPDVSYVDLELLSVEIPKIGLQFSIHETTDEKRNELIPFKKKLSLEEIAHRGECWNALTRRKPFFNYCAHEGNTSDRDAAALQSLFDPYVWEATVSVVCEREETVSAANDRQRQLAHDFTSKLVERGFSVRMFDPAGQDDIGGGCGQLWFVQEWMRENPDKARPSVGRSLPVVHTPTK